MKRASSVATLNQLGQAPPSFVGNDYYCESGSPNHPTGSSFTWFTGDPLWDGAGCGGQEGPCCNRAGLPWFKKSLSIPTTASISVRVCRDTSSILKFTSNNISSQFTAIFASVLSSTAMNRL